MKLSASAIANIDAAVASSTADPHRGLPRAVVMVTSKDGLLHTTSAGYAQLPAFGAPPAEFAAAEKISHNSVFELWSCTKLVTVVAALKLYEEGKLDLASDASVYVPELKAVKILTGYEGENPILVENDVVITVENLITHVAGFTYGTADNRREKYRVDNAIPTASGPDASTEAITKIPLMNKPQSTWEYGTNNDWLALCVEAASGQSLEAYFQEHIFDPLGMDEISFEILGRGKINMARTPANPSDPYEVETGVNFPFRRAFGGHGLLGSPASYIKLLRAILCGGAVDGKRILKPETVKEMFIPRLNAVQQAALKVGGKDGADPFTRKRDLAEYTANAKGAQWGLGGLLSQEDLSSGRKTGSLSWSGMASTYWVIDPATEIAFVVFTNVVPYGPQQIWDLWEKVETAIYAGLEK